MARKQERRPPVHPGEILKEEFMVPMGLSANKLAGAMHVPAGRLTQIINGQRTITADTALRLSAYFGTTAELWLNLQSNYELELARDSSADEITSSIKPHVATQQLAPTKTKKVPKRLVRR